MTIDTLSHQGLNNAQNCIPSAGDLTASTCFDSAAMDPVDVQASQGIPASKVLPDATDVFYNLHYPGRTKTGGSHVLTGPIYIEDAEPGDTLEVRIMKVKRVLRGDTIRRATAARFLDISPILPAK